MPLWQGKRRAPADSAPESEGADPVIPPSTEPGPHPVGAQEADQEPGRDNLADRETRRPHDDREAAKAHRRGRPFLRGLWVAVREVVIVVAMALVLAFIAKTWLVQSFYIPSGSMLNTLAEDDRVLVSKLTPGPFELRRGDIVVFEDPAHWLPDRVPAGAQRGWRETANTVLTWVGLLPSDSGNHLIKRVIGLPGDRVACCSRNGRLMVNGTAVTEPYLHPGDPPAATPFDVTVPKDKLWVMGDHRSNSADSRFNDTADAFFGQADEKTATDKRNNTGYYGSVPVDQVVGKAFAVILPLSKFGALSTPDETFRDVAASAAAPAPVASSAGSAR